ncbi:glycosyltransferase family 2 protein [Peribacillus simplex]|uniref:glycosyltransferase family 2 protein n=1 Tax=Peribacillus simplex TaxID=1478 RepID=UPI003CF0806C
MSKLLSVVIIGINESSTIKKTVESVIEHTRKIDCEYIYVDSGSTDNTINIVKHFNEFRIIKVSSNYPTAALGRKVGSELASGKFILFLDGDMEITKESDLLYCLNLLLEQSEIGVISGKLPEIIYNNNVILKRKTDRYNVNDSLEKMKEPGGYFIIKKEILSEVGNFDYTFKSNEEIELMSRIRKCGYKVYRTNKLICIHHHHKNGYSNAYTKFKSKYFADTWKVLWKCSKNKNLRYYLEFKNQFKNILRILLTSIMIILILLSIINIYFLVIPIVYYISLLLLSNFEFAAIIRKELSSIITIVSIVFLFRSNNTSYEFMEMKNLPIKKEG